jgi:sec-independent protein translocase protein TatB
MFGIDFSEILVIFGIALVVLGPEKLPRLAATVGRWIGRARHMARQFREQLEQEAETFNRAVELRERDAATAKTATSPPATPPPVTPASAPTAEPASAAPSPETPPPEALAPEAPPPEAAPAEASAPEAPPQTTAAVPSSEAASGEVFFDMPEPIAEPLASEAVTPGAALPEAAAKGVTPLENHPAALPLEVHERGQ